MPIPEVDTDLALARSALADCGAVIFRRALPPAAIRQLELMCNALFSIMDLKVIEASAGEVRPDDPLRDHVERYSKLQFIAGDVARTLLAPTYLCRAGYDRIADTVRAPVERGLGRTLSFLPGKSTFRRQSSAQRPAYVGWHRDAHAIQAASSEGYLVCWLPLQSVGKARPSLQIVVGSNRTPARYVEHDDRMDDMIRERYGEELSLIHI